MAGDSATVPAVPTIDDIEAHDPLHQLEMLVMAWLLGQRSPHTRRAYRGDVRSWAKWCLDHDLGVWPPTRQRVDGWRTSMESAGLASATIARKMTALSSLAEYAVDEELLDRNPVARAKRPRVARDEAKLVRLSLIELRQVIAVADADRRLWVSALVRLLAVHGLRCGEAIGARVGDLSTADGHRTLGLRRKGGKTSVTPLPSSTAIVLDELALGRASEDLLLGVTYSRAWRAIRRVGEQARLARLHPHSLRAAFVSQALDAGVLLDRVQAAASHADPRTTMSYDRWTLDLDGHPAHVLAGLVAS